MPSDVDYSMKSIEWLQKTLISRLGALADISGADLGLIQADAALETPRKPSVSDPLPTFGCEILGGLLLARSSLSGRANIRPHESVASHRWPGACRAEIEHAPRELVYSSVERVR